MSYYQYDGGRRGFMSNVPVAVKNLIIINVLVMIMTSLNENFSSIPHHRFFTGGSR